MVTYDKRKAVKFETAKDFLAANREFVFKQIRSDFKFYMYNFNEVVKDYFGFITDSNYNEIFTQVIDKKSVKVHVKISIDKFQKGYKLLDKNYVAVNKFNDDLRRDAFRTKSM